MGDWPLIRGGSRFESDARSSSTMIGVTSGGSSNAKGSWTQLIASTLFNADAITIWGLVNDNTRNALIDIGIGASSSEVVLVPNLGVSRPSNLASTSQGCITIPIHVPIGSRISARIQATSSSVPGLVGVTLHACGPGQPRGFQRATDYGTTTATSLGTSVDPGGTANTKGSYSELTSSCTYPVKAIIITANDAATSDATAQNSLLDIAIGAGGSEQVVLPNIVVQKYFGFGNPWLGPFPVSIPAGTRIAARSQCSSTSASIRVLSTNIICLD